MAKVAGAAKILRCHSVDGSDAPNGQADDDVAVGAHRRIERYLAGNVGMGDVRARENPECQERLYQEIVSVVGTERMVTEDDLPKSCDQGDSAAEPSRATLACPLDRGRHHPWRLRHPQGKPGM